MTRDNTTLTTARFGFAKFFTDFVMTDRASIAKRLKADERLRMRTSEIARIIYGEATKSTMTMTLNLLKEVK